ncbi:MAG TPA: GNAT family N-acetyltransferase [Mycobacterium sp.]|nr:GNAT family N-acetyltransferase [Mycobacterium sp.]
MGDHSTTDQTQVAIRDGRTVLLRRLGRRDAQAALALHQQLPDTDRYLRFFSPGRGHLDRLARQLTERSDSCYALGAFDAGRLIGVAHYVIDEDDPRLAEVAIAVAGDDHHVGVGTALLRRLAEIATAHGVSRFTADVLATNHLMLQVIADIDWPRTNVSDDASVLRFQITLPRRATPTARRPRSAEG